MKVLMKRVFERKKLCKGKEALKLIFVDAENAKLKKTLCVLKKKALKMENKSF